jgi:predicted ATPase
MKRDEQSPEMNFLTSIFIRNFKSLSFANIKVKPLTLLVGQNSVGKSSAVQALMTLSQWIRSGAPLEKYYFNGPQVRVGRFADVRTVGNPYEPIALRVETSAHTLHIDVLGDGGNEDEDYGNPHIQNFSFKGKSFSSHLRQNDEPVYFSMDFYSQTIESSVEYLDEGSGETRIAKKDIFFGPRSFRKEISEPPFFELEGLGLKDLFDIEYQEDFSLEGWVGRELGALAAMQVDLEFIKLSNPNIVIEYQDLGEFLIDFIAPKIPEGKPAMLYANLAEGLLKEAKEEVKRSPGKWPSIAVVDFMGRFEVKLKFLLESYGGIGFPWSAGKAASLQSPRVFRIPKFNSYYATSPGQTEPFDRLGLEDSDAVSEVLKELGISQAFSNLLEGSPEERDYFRFIKNERLRWFGELYNHYDRDWVKTPLDSANEEIVEFQNFLANRLSYLGPLRVDGFSRTFRGTSIPEGSPVGSSGEYTSLLLLDCMEKDKPRLLPYFDNRTHKWVNKEVTFNESISSWFQLFTIPDALLSVEDSGKFGVQVEMGGRTLDQFGTGASQVLPILALILSRNPGDVVILEQPELHLHPGGQQYLADFFMASIERGVQIIFETHSEYMVNRIRRGVVLGLTPSENIQIVNFEQNEKGLAEVTNVGLTESGGFSDWPKGFFAQTEEDLLDIIEALEEKQ